MRNLTIIWAALAAFVLHATEPVAFDKELLKAKIAEAIDAAARPISGGGAPPATKRVLVAWTPADYAPSQYGSFAIGMTRGGFRLTRQASEIQLHATGRFKPSGIGNPGQVAELAGSAYELVVNVEFRSPDRSTRIAGPFQVRWAGHRLLTTAPDTEYWSDPIPGTYDDGTWCQYDAAVWRVASVGQFVDGEPGQLAVTGPFWPRTEGVGGGSGTYEVYGTKFTSDTGAAIAPWITALDAGTFTGPGGCCTTINAGGWAPIAVTGISPVSGQRLSLVQWSDSIARSHDSVNRERADSGTGYIRASTRGEHGGFQSSISGQRLADVVQVTNVAQRWAYQHYADGAVVGLISNDLKERSLEATEDDFRAFCQRLRDAGNTWIAAETCLLRWSSSDSWTTYSGQTPQIAGFNEKALAWDARLQQMLAEGVIDRIIDRRPSVQDPAEGFRWRLPAVVTTFATVAPSTMGAPRATGTGWVPDRFTNRHVSYDTNTTLYPVYGNNSVALSVNAGTNGATVLAAGVPVKILDVYTVDGVHTAPHANAVLAAGIPASTYEP